MISKTTICARPGVRVRLSCAIAGLLLLSLSHLGLSPAFASPDDVITATVDLNHGTPVNRVVPQAALGAALDGLNQGDVDQVYTPKNLAVMRSTGLHSLSYRLRTELGIEAWHWNPAGQWSDPAHQQGYWTSSSESKAPILTCNGYWLPRRGNTFDQANNEGYSRLDDGKTTTFWKSNPYLSQPLSKEDHPQWIIVGFKKPQSVDTIKIAWGTPFATKFCVQYYVSPDGAVLEDINDTLNSSGHWQSFPAGTITNGSGGVETVRLAPSALTVQYLRIRLLQSSGGGKGFTGDIRDNLGYAVRELWIGSTDNSGAFHDLVRHGQSSAHQTTTYVSSTDPWHRSVDIDLDTEQPGFDRVFRSGLSGGERARLPAMLPVSLFYGTPENAVAEVKFMRSRGYPVHYLEMGEEPDGQYLAPEDYGALYIRFADALHRYDPTLKLGGPCYQGMTWTAMSWPDETGSWLWTLRFIRYLKSHHKLDELGFWSTESYFFDDIGSDPAQNILGVPSIVNRACADYYKDGLPRSVPLFVTEYGYSPYATEAEVDLPGALLDADFIGAFLAAGGKGAYFYGLEPNALMLEAKPGATWGNLTMFLSDDSHNITAPVPAYYALQMVIRRWASSANLPVNIYPASTSAVDANGQSLVTAYALQRADHTWSLMLVNKNPKESYTVKIGCRNITSGQGSLVSPVYPSTVWQYSPKQYLWHANGPKGYALPNLPSVELAVSRDGLVHLPAYSLTIVNWVND